MPVGEKIRLLRTAKGWSSGRLSQESGVSRAYLWQLEIGGKDQPSFTILEKLAGALGVSVSEFSEADPGDNGVSGLPPGLLEFLQTRGPGLQVRKADIEMMKNIHFRSQQPDKPEDWELLFLFLRKWVR